MKRKNGSWKNIVKQQVVYGGVNAVNENRILKSHSLWLGVKDLDAELVAGKSITCSIIERDNSFFERTIYNSGHQVAKIAAAYGEEFSSTCYPHMGDQPFKVKQASYLMENYFQLPTFVLLKLR